MAQRLRGRVRAELGVGRATFPPAALPCQQLTNSFYYAACLDRSSCTLLRSENSSSLPWQHRAAAAAACSSGTDKEPLF